MSPRILVSILAVYLSFPLHADEPKPAASAPFDAAAAFGARPSVSGLRLSPDGMSVSYLAPTPGQGSILYTLRLAKGSSPKAALSADGKPFRLENCSWVSNDRLVCTTYAILSDPTIGLAPVTRLLAVNADGSNLQVLSTRDTPDTLGFQFAGGDIIDWLPDEDGTVLMTRGYLPERHTGSRLGSDTEGVGVDSINTRTLAVKHVVAPVRGAYKYITDGRGSVRIMGIIERKGTGQDTGVLLFSYRLPGSSQWQPLSKYDEKDFTGFLPVAVDHDLNVAYGYKLKDGRFALYALALDGSMHEELVYAHADVDVDGLVRIGRRKRVVGVSYATDKPQSAYFAPEIKSLIGSLAKALPKQPILEVVDSSVDESKLLIFAGSDSDPGVYYFFDKKSHELATFLVVRDQLEGVSLASVKPVSYPSSDGVMIPGYLTLPPGRDSAKGLPAIVLPHGGPTARDEWGFDWLSQFYASRGYAVLQPNFRGSFGYGNAWRERNGFQSWRIAIGDVLAGGRWLVSEGIADPAKLAIVGWSYGGYAALESAIVDPTLFKAVVAIAPVTDLNALKQEHRHWTDFNVVSNFVGSGAETREGSPAEHADRIKAPVLMFHGTLDRNVSIEQSKEMASRLHAAGAQSELVTFQGLDHYLEDSDARTEMLRKTDLFLRHAWGE